MAAHASQSSSLSEVEIDMVGVVVAAGVSRVAEGDEGGTPSSQCLKR